MYPCWFSSFLHSLMHLYLMALKNMAVFSYSLRMWSYLRPRFSERLLLPFQTRLFWGQWLCILRCIYSFCVWMVSVIPNYETQTWFQTVVNICWGRSSSLCESSCFRWSMIILEELKKSQMNPRTKAGLHLPSLFHTLVHSVDTFVLVLGFNFIMKIKNPIYKS